MTIITYNNISLGFVHTIRVGQQAVMDPSNTDMLYTKFSIHTRSVLALVDGPRTSGLKTPAAGGGSSTGVSRVAGEAPGDTIKRIRHMLLVPRREFIMTVGASTMIDVPAFNGEGDALDDANGPKPISCDIVQITEGTFLIDYHVEVCLTDCGNLPDVNQISTARFKRVVATRPDWLSLRWTMSHDIDENGYSSISYQGGLICKSSILTKGGPDSLRGMVTPIPIPGFKRHSHYSVTPDGLTLNFSFTDTEMYITPPPGTVKAAGTHTVSTPNGALFLIDVNLHLDGRKEMDKKTLMEMAVAIAYDKIQKSKPVETKGLIIIKQGSFQDEMYGPGVTVHLQAQASGPRKNKEQKTKTDLLNRFLLAISGANVGRKIVEKLLDKESKDQQQKVQKIIDTFGFGGDPLGSSKAIPILMTFGERGYLPFLYLMASGFNDPCLVNIVSLPSQESGLKSATAGVSALKAALSILGGGSPAGTNTNNNTSLNTKTSGDVLTSSIDTLSTGFLAGAIAATQNTSTISIVENLEAFSDTGVTPYVEDEVTEGIWESYYCRYAYHRDTGKRAFPAMQSDSKDVVYPKLYDDVGTVRVQWIAKKVGEPPTVPDPDPVDDNLILLEAIEGYPNVGLAADGESLEYTHTGEYVYGAVDWTKVNKTWPIPPWLDKSQDELSELTLGVAVDDSQAETAAESQLNQVGA